MAEQGSGRRRWTCKGKGNLPIITQSMQWVQWEVVSFYVSGKRLSNECPPWSELHMATEVYP